MALLADGGPVKAAPPPPPPPPPPPQDPAAQKKMDAAISTAEKQRAAAGGSGTLKADEIPHPVQPGDNLTNISRTYGAKPNELIADNPQVKNPDLIHPGQVVFAPTHDQKTIDTRTNVIAAEKADQSVSALEQTQRDPKATPGERKMAAMDLSDARNAQSQAWGKVRTDAENEIRDAGAKAPFPVDKNTQGAVDQMRSRAPESPDYQKAVSDAQKTVTDEWNKNRTTGAQLDDLTKQAQAQDKSVAALEATQKDPKATPGERKMAGEDLSAARSAAADKWNAVQSAAERELRATGGKGPFPDEAAKPTLDALKASHPNDKQFQQQITEAQQTVDAQWRDNSTTRAELNDLSKSVQGAEQNLASIESLSRSGSQTDRKLAQIELPDARNAANNARSALQNEVAGDLRTLGEGKDYPEEKTADAFKQLKSQLPDDPNVQSVADAAQSQVTDEWHQQGWTRDTLGKVVSGYDDVKSAQAAADAAKTSTNPAERADAADLQTTADQKKADLRAEMQRQIQSASDAVPDDKKEAAATGRALIMQQQGPQEEGYQTLVDEAHTAVVVTPRVDAVKAAYDKGGAKEAAAELDKQTTSASPETAQRVIDASMPTIDKITSDLGKSTGPGAPIPWEGGKGPSDVFLHLSNATSHAALSNDGKATADKVAESVIKGAPDGVGVPPYTWAAERAVVEGGGADLSVAMARQLTAQGKPDDAAAVLNSVQGGLDELKSQTKSAVEDFKKATETVVRLRQDWGGVMSPEQLDAATEKYVNDHPDVLADFNKTYGDLERLGLNSERAARALEDPQLQGLENVPNFGQFKDARNGFVNDDNVKIVMAESQPAKNEVMQSALLGEAIDKDGAGKSPGDPASLANKARGSVKEVGNSVMIVSSASSAADVADFAAKGLIAPGQKVPDFFGSGEAKLDPKKVTNFSGALNGLGAAFNGLAAYGSFEKLANGDGTVGDAVKATYYSMGAAKETAEGLAFVTSRGWLGPIGAPPTVQRAAASVLASTDRSAPGLTAISRQPGWVKFSTFMKAAGAAIDVGYSIDSLAKGDYPAAGLYATSAGGGVLMTLAGYGAIGSWGGPVGAGITLVSGGALWLYKDGQEKAKMEGPSKDFLTAAGMKPDVAEQLVDYDNNDGSSPGPVIAASMKQFGVDPSNFIDTMNRMDPDKVHDFAKAAWTVEPNDQGQFPLTTATDNQVWAPGSKDPEFGGHYLYNPQDTRYRGTYDTSYNGGYYPIHVTEPNPRSLTAFKDYSKALFGEGVVGQ